MILDFDTMNVTELPNFYGGEKSILAKLSSDGLNKIMVGRVAPGASIGVHTHGDPGTRLRQLHVGRSEASLAALDRPWRTPGHTAQTAKGGEASRQRPRTAHF